MGDFKGPDEKTVTQSVDIPEFLKPFITQSAGTAQRSASELERLLGGNTVAGFNQDQRQAINLTRDIATGGGDILPTATDAFFRAARGDLLPDSTGVDALTATARGDFLEGDAFLGAFDAASRRAQPGVLSAFGAAGGARGGLARVALEQARADAFAGLFDNERQRQVGAAGTLTNLLNSERSRQLSAASGLPGIALTGAGLLSDIGGQQQQQEQRELLGPIEAQLQLLNSAQTGLPITSLLGQSTTEPIFQNKTGQLLGAGLSLAGLATGFPGAGALAGGLFGGGGVGTDAFGLSNILTPPGGAA